MDKQAVRRLTKKQIINIFKKTGAFQEGHFLLSSGLHSQCYCQCSQVLQYPKYTQLLCRELAKKFKGKRIDVVIGPAYGGIVVSYEVARYLGSRALFTERLDGKMVLRRNFSLKKDERTLIAEDVITTGGSVKEVINLVKSKGAKLVGIVALLDRSNQKINLGLPVNSLIKRKVTNYSKQNCPLCKNNIPLVKPGSKCI